MDCDIVIAGGGPAGLAAACSILRAVPELRIKVFESAHEYRPQGAGVLVNLNGQNALEAIDPQLYARMKSRSVSVLGGETMDKDGKNGTFREMGKMFGLNLKEKYGKSLFFLGWHEIRETLYEGLPPGVVEFGRRYASYEDQGEDGVVVKFKDGSSVRTRMLVGADGYFSKVRQQMLGDGPPEFTGNIMWRARFPLRQEFSTDRTRWWRENVDNLRGRFAVIFPIDKQHVTFVANAPVEHLDRHGLPFKADTSRSVQEDVYQKDNLQRCLTVFQDFDERLLKVLRDTDPSTVTEHGLYERPPDKMPDEGWCRGNVTIIGDAAHAGLPNGQGLNLAIEDGAVLGWHVREGGISPETLRRFNAERGPRVREVLTKALDSHQGPEKVRILYETTFRPVQAHRPEQAAAAEPEVAPGQPASARQCIVNKSFGTGVMA
ncbi:probable FAD-dependent urate hydroxylase [Coccomyxa sp. Obi]|nr:probable FAD-dependent urate hydroxylase [Coccomyxa sp. Obi]